MRTYGDDSFDYCLDDGAALVFGSSRREETTVPLPGGIAASEAPTRQSAPSAPPAAMPSAEEKSIAVLPFTNMSADADNDYFCDGLSEEILDSLTKIEGLKVAARTSAFSFKGKNIDAGHIGNALRVNHVLEGSVRRSGNRLRISVQLVNASDGYHLWSERYDREMDDVFAIQDEITMATVDALKLKLFGREKANVLKRHTEKADAYQLYLRGRFFWNKRTPEGIQKAVEYFEQAIEKDPNYALAYSGLADCYNSFGYSFDFGMLSTREVIPKAKAAAVRALEIDDSLAEAHTSLAYAKQLFDWDWAAAESGFTRALKLNPNYTNANHWYSHFLMAMGRLDESLIQSLRAIELDPLNLVMHTHLGWHYLFARQYDQAISQLKATLTLDPSYAMAQWYLALAYQLRGEFDQAAIEFDKTGSLLEGNAIVEADIAHFYAASGQFEKAELKIAELEELSKKIYVSPFAIALIHIGLSDKERAFQLLDSAFDDRSDMLVYLKVDPRLDTLRADERFDHLLKKMKFPVSHTA